MQRRSPVQHQLKQVGHHPGDHETNQNAENQGQTSIEHGKYLAEWGYPPQRTPYANGGLLRGASRFATTKAPVAYCSDLGGTARTADVTAAVIEAIAGAND